MDNNKVYLLGEILTELTFSCEMYGKKFYQCDLGVSRLSEGKDTIPLLVSERVLMNVDMSVGSKIKVKGIFRTHRVAGENEKCRLALTVLVRNLMNVTEESKENNLNQIYLEGFVCMKPNYRKTPFGREISDLLIAVNRFECKNPNYRKTPFGRGISDLLIAVNRLYNEYDYIPCIAWNQNARYCETMEVGERIRVYGRAQSREYERKFEDGTVEKRVVYEVSVTKLKKIKDEEDEEDNEEIKWIKNLDEEFKKHKKEMIKREGIEKHKKEMIKREGIEKLKETLIKIKRLKDEAIDMDPNKFKYCRNCGNKLPNIANFCDKCGEYTRY